jgi:hypothetical protein
MKCQECDGKRAVLYNDGQREEGTPDNCRLCYEPCPNDGFIMAVLSVDPLGRGIVLECQECGFVWGKSKVKV